MQWVKKKNFMGDKRILKKFAWFPVSIEEDKRIVTVWLECYYELQEFTKDIDSYGLKWKLKKRLTKAGFILYRNKYEK